MKILFLTQYYPPETGAPQNRLHDLAVRLKDRGFEVTVLTAMPNYPKMKIYEGYRNRLFCKEEIDGIKVYRSWIYVSKNRSIIPRLLNYFSFVKTSFIAGIFIKGKFDYILCESPPLFLGITAMLLKRIKRAKLIFNVSDLWPESAEKLGLVTNKYILNISKRLEENIYRNSDFISGQTQGIVVNIKKRFPYNKIHWLKNGADIEYFLRNTRSGNWRKENGFSKEDFILLYGGIIGHAQGLEVILKAAEMLIKYDKIKFVLVGDGPEKESLLNMKDKLKLDNVYFIDNVDKPTMLTILNEIDASVIPLKKLDLFKGAIPSKIFENLILKKPVLLGVDGEAKELFIDEGKCGLYFEPENNIALSEQIIALYNSPDLFRELGENAYKYVVENFSRDKIAENFINFILQN